MIWSAKTEQDRDEQGEILEGGEMFVSQLSTRIQQVNMETYIAIAILIATSLVVTILFCRTPKENHELKTTIAKIEMQLQINHDRLIAYIDNKLQKDLEDLELKIYQVLPAAFPLICGKKE